MSEVIKQVNQYIKHNE